MGMFTRFTRVTGWRPQTSHPLPQRTTHHTDDTRDYIQPTPGFDPRYYLNYWNGNQLPGRFINVQNHHLMWVSVKDKRTLYTNSPYAAQRTKGSFNANLSQQSSADIVALWRAVWAGGNRGDIGGGQ